MSKVLALIMLPLLLGGCALAPKRPPAIVIFDVFPIDPPITDYDYQDCATFGQDAAACRAILKI